MDSSRVTNIFYHMTWKKVPAKTPSLKPSSWTIRVPDLCGLLYPSQSSRWHLLYSCTFVLLYLLPTFYLPHNPHTASYVPGFFFSFPTEKSPNLAHCRKWCVLLPATQYIASTRASSDIHQCPGWVGSITNWFGNNLGAVSLPFPSPLGASGEYLLGYNPYTTYNPIFEEENSEKKKLGEKKKKEVGNSRLLEAFWHKREDAMR